MTYTSIKASGLLIRIGLLQREVVESSAKGFHDGATVRKISEMGRLIEELEQEAVREYLSIPKEAA